MKRILEHLEKQAGKNFQGQDFQVILNHYGIDLNQLSNLNLEGPFPNNLADCFTTNQFEEGDEEDDVEEVEDDEGDDAYEDDEYDDEEDYDHDLDSGQFIDNCDGEEYTTEDDNNYQSDTYSESQNIIYLYTVSDEDSQRIEGEPVSQAIAIRVIAEDDRKALQGHIESSEMNALLNRHTLALPQ